MKKNILLLLIALSCIGAAAERRDSVSVWGQVTDMFTGEEITEGLVTVVDERDSVVVNDSIYPAKDAYWGTWKYKTESGYKFKLAKGGAYKIRFTAEGYADDWYDLNIPERQYHKYTKEWMQKYKLRKLPKEHVIDGVTVRATRIKMVVKGDTVEYNADAFNLAEGSMLDKLIEAMPGMELGDDGVITHNGKQVESLLVNGKDFFDGDPKTALENLPAYTVKKVQVYRKEDDGAFLVKDSVKREEQKKLVVDVKLKKEYNKGWLINTDLAGGSAGRYTAKGVAMYYTDQLKFMAAGGLNNLNDRGLANREGNLNSRTSPRGLHNIKKGQMGIQYTKDKDIEISAGLDVTHANDDDESMTSSATYLTGGDTYSRLRSMNSQSQTELSFYTWLRKTTLHTYLYAHPLRITHSRTRSHGSNQSATFSDDPADSYRGAALDSVFLPFGSRRLEQIMTNRILDQTMTETRQSGLSSNADLGFKSPIFGNEVHVNYEINASRGDNDRYQHYLLNNYATNEVDFRNIATFAPTRSYDYRGRATYDIEVVKHWDVNFIYEYKQQYSMNNSDRYRLDSLDGWGADTQQMLGALPSSRDSMLTAMDIRNSYHTSKLNRRNMLQVSSWFKIAEGWNGWIGLPLTLYNYAAWDNRNNYSQRKVNNMKAFDPNFSINHYKQGENGKVSMGNLRYSFNHTAREATDLLDIYDDTNPLFLREANPSLKSPRSHSIGGHYRYSNKEHMQNYGVWGEWNVVGHSIANATIYDRATGITTYKPLNISGNWSANIGSHFSRNIDKKERLELSNGLRLNYQHSADYISDTQGDVTALGRSVVDNYDVNYRFHLKYMVKKTNVRLEGSARWLVQNSDRPGFNRVSAVDFNYGVKANGPIVWGVEYDTELMMYSRRGYNDSSMNDDNLIWNISLSRSFLKGKPLTLRLQIVDALAQRSNVQNTINAQGRTEVWYNSVPRYALLHVAYKFNTMSKKKKSEDNNQ